MKYFLICAFLGFLNLNAQPDDHQYLLREKLPAWAIEKMTASNTFSTHAISDYINPFYLEGDFNADDKLDIAILLEETKTRKKGFIILHSDNDAPVMIGAGTKISNGSDDFSWMDVWKAYRDEKCTPSMGETKPIFLTCDGIWMAKSESASALLFWTGKFYKWSQQSD
jgi:hypothetical protein